MKKLNIGIIGVGAFGKFLLSTYTKMSEIKILGINSKEEKELKKLAKKFKIPYFSTDYKRILGIKDIDIIVIATPPFLHAKIAIDAIKAKKHVLCEKPIALTIEEANKIKNALKKSKTLFSVDYILRKNKIILLLKEMIDKKIFGNVQNLVFENFAADTLLDENHWFWDKKKSGGIWIEHGVHFFDIFEFLVSQKINTILSLANSRNKKIEDQVAALCLYNKGVFASFVHSFTKPIVIEKTQTFLSFDKGYAKINGWIPEDIKIEGLVNEKEWKELNSIFKGANIISKKLEYKKIKGRGKEHHVTRKINLHFKLKKPKLEIYQDLIKKVMLDLIKAINNPKHKLEIDFETGFSSLKVALLAEKNTKIVSRI